MPAEQPFTRYALAGRVVTQDATHTVLDAGVVYVDGPHIAAVLPASDPPLAGFEDVPRLETGGSIYPGLTELHNHLNYNALPPWPVPRRFGHRDEWLRHVEYRRLVSGPMTVLKASRRFIRSLARFAECKCLVAGVTTSQGIALKGENSPSLFAGLVRNVERSGRPELPNVRTRIAAVAASDLASVAPLLRRTDLCYLHHLSEGANAKARAEFTVFRTDDGAWAIGPALAGIHALGLAPEDFAPLGAAGASMVWSPLSNLLLYGQTAHVDAAHDNGVLIGLGSDWAPSGSRNLLGEMKVARLWSAEHGGVFTDRDILDMATRNPARILRWDAHLGSLEAGKLADLIVVTRPGADPYAPLLEATEADIALVIIDGAPRCGLPAWMDALHAPGEQVDIAGAPRTLQLNDSDAALPTLAAARATLAELLHDLPAIAAQPPDPFEAGGPELLLEYEEEVATPDPFEAAIPLAELVVSMTPDPLVLAGDADYWTLFDQQPNLPDYIKSGLPPLYAPAPLAPPAPIEPTPGEPELPPFNPYKSPTSGPLADVLHDISVCRDPRCFVPQKHPFYPIPLDSGLPPVHEGRRACMPVVPAWLKPRNIMVVGEYPNCRFATAHGRTVPIADIDQPFATGRYYDGRAVREYPTGDSLDGSYFAPLGLDRTRDLWLTNMVKCFLIDQGDWNNYFRLGWVQSGGPVQPTREDYAKFGGVCMLNHLVREIELCDPILIIALGSNVCGFVHGSDDGVFAAPNPFSSLIGKPLRAGQQGAKDTRNRYFRDRNVFHFYHPSALIRPDGLAERLQNHALHLQEARNFMVELGLANFPNL